MTMTALNAAFTKAGIRPEDVEFDKAITKYLNCGGTIERAQQRLALAAAKLPSEGQKRIADSGPENPADAGSPLPSEGHDGLADYGPSPLADARRPITSGGGQRPRADNGLTFVAAPAREPSTAQIAAATNAKQQAAMTVLDTRKTHDGRPWGDVHYHELRSLDRDGKVANAVEAYLGVLPDERRFEELRKLIKPAEFQVILTRVERSNAA